MKLIDDIMDAMGIVDEVEEETPSSSREERLAKAEKEKGEKATSGSKLKGIFSKKSAAPDHEESVEAREESSSSKRKLNFNFSKKTDAEPVEAAAKYSSGRSGTRKGGPAFNSGSVNMQVLEPTSFDDSQKVADCLHNNQPVIVNFEHTDHVIAKRMTDFISGTIYALQGNMKKIGRNILICAPKNVDIDSGLGFDTKNEDGWNNG